MVLVQPTKVTPIPELPVPNSWWARGPAWKTMDPQDYFVESPDGVLAGLSLRRRASVIDTQVRNATWSWCFISSRRLSPRPCSLLKIAASQPWDLKQHVVGPSEYPNEIGGSKRPNMTWLGRLITSTIWEVLADQMKEQRKTSRMGVG